MHDAKEHLDLRIRNRGVHMVVGCGVSRRVHNRDSSSSETSAGG
jgi:hypothetical protein